MIIIALLLVGVAIFWALAISLACVVVHAQDKQKKCKHIWIKEISDSAYFERCSICKKIR